MWVNAHSYRPDLFGNGQHSVDIGFEDFTYGVPLSDGCRIFFGLG